MKYAKIVNGHLEYAPRNKNSVSNWINDVEAVLAEGYLPVELQDIPEDKYQVGYEVAGGVIVRKLEDIPVLDRENKVRAVRNSYLEQYVDPKQLVMVWDSLSADDKKLYADYRQYLLDYTKTKEWYLQNPMTLMEWEATLVPASEDVVELSEASEDIVELYSMEI